MTDPAIAAADRVAREITTRVYYHHLLDAAREALAPLRKRHYLRDDPEVRRCHWCGTPWPCPDARDIYPESEL